MKALVTLDLDHVAPRFDLAAEVWVGHVEDGGRTRGGKTLVLSAASADELCRLVLTEKVERVVCGAVEDKYFEYLQWKGVTVVDSVVGPLTEVIAALGRGDLAPGAVFEPVDRAP